MDSGTRDESSAECRRFFVAAVIVLLLLIPPALASGEDVTCTFVTPSKPLVAGQRSGLWLYCMNNSSNEVSRLFERSFDGKLGSGSGSFETVLSLNTVGNETEVTIPPGGFVKEEYLLDVPATLQGQVELVISHYNELVVQVEAPSPGTSPPPQPGPALPAKESAPSTLSTNGQYVTDRLHHLSPYLSPYEPIYFVLGTQPAAEFQFSLKYQLFSMPNPPHWLPVTDTYFAYTQTSFWSLFSAHAAFYDTDYKPSGFFYFPGVLDFHDEVPARLDLQLGYEHESNGHGGSTEERAMNTLYLQPSLTLGRTNGWQLYLQPRAWVYVFGLPDNPDMPAYHGYADLLTTVAWKECQLSTFFGVGDEGTHTRLQLVFRYHLPRLFHRFGFDPGLQVQYFRGYEQSLRQYDRVTHAVRAGLSLYDNPPAPD
jgi:outer membrane phospholipase A